MTSPPGDPKVALNTSVPTSLRDTVQRYADTLGVSRNTAAILLWRKGIDAAEADGSLPPESKP